MVRKGEEEKAFWGLLFSSLVQPMVCQLKIAVNVAQHKIINLFKTL